jgi:hypothetical protein
MHILVDFGANPAMSMSAVYELPSLPFRFPYAALLLGLRTKQLISSHLSL